MTVRYLPKNFLFVLIFRHPAVENMKLGQWSVTLTGIYSLCKQSVNFLVRHVPYTLCPDNIYYGRRKNFMIKL